jgi:SPP1 family predicted phage head-tail adaptor
MAYSTGFLKHRVQILNRTAAQVGKFGLDGSGIEFELTGVVWASVDWVKGKQPMVAGALDVYGVILVRMRYNTLVNERSRIVYDGRTYQILGDYFHADRQENTIQFHAQQVVEK